MNRWKRILSALRAEDTDAISEEGDRRVAENLAIWRGRPPWLGKTGGRTLHLGRTVCREAARTVCSELTVRAEDAWLDRQMNRFLPHFPEIVSAACGVGQCMIRLYPAKGGVYAEAVLPDRYAVLARDASGRARHVCFFEECREGDNCYLRREEHQMSDDGLYRITSRVYLIEDGTVIREVPMASVAHFAPYPEQVTIGGVTDGFFAEWRMDASDGGMVGCPIWGSAISLMEDADRQYERLLWEFEGGELAVDVGEDAFQMSKDGLPIIPEGRDRLFRLSALDGQGDGTPLFQVFSPALRDESLIRGLNRILMFFEDAVGMARGTVSDPDVAAKTATEVRASKQRTYLTVMQIRRQAEQVLRAIAKGMWQMGRLYRMCSAREMAICIRFGDSVLNDGENERTADRADFAAGLMTKEEYRAKWIAGEDTAERRWRT